MGGASRIRLTGKMEEREFLTGRPEKVDLRFFFVAPVSFSHDILPRPKVMCSEIFDEIHSLLSLQWNLKKCLKIDSILMP